MQVSKFKTMRGWVRRTGHRAMKLIVLSLLALLMTSMTSFAEEVDYQACDDPESKEKVRIYFSNGMNNGFVDAGDAFLETKQAIGYNDALGITPLSYGLSYNLNEDFLTQLSQVFWQKNIELHASFTQEDFWLWYFNPNADQVPQWFTDEHIKVHDKLIKGSLTSDPHFQNHRQNYISDLRSGKKVIIVAHSQGNLYATLAARSIRAEFPEYRDSIGVIGFGSAASPNAYLHGKYFTNFRDFIIAGLRVNFGSGNVTPGNVRFSNNLLSDNHAYIDSYLNGTSDSRHPNVRTLLKQEVFALSTKLKLPKNECEVKVSTLNPADVTYTAATLRGELSKGKQVVTWFNLSNGGTPGLCKGNAAGQSGSGINASQIFAKTIGVKDDSVYSYRACGKSKEGAVTDGGVVTFETPPYPPTKVRTRPASNIKEDQATLNGLVITGHRVTTWFRRSATTSSIACGPPPATGASINTRLVQTPWTGLKPDSTYYYRFCGKGLDGVTYAGGVENFKTAPPTPTRVTTLGVSNITETSAIIRGRIDSGKNIDAWFRLYTHSGVSCASTYDGKGTGNTGQTFADPVVVNPGTTYYFRFCGKDRYGNVSTGGLVSFRTPARVPTRVSTGSATNVTDSKVTLSGVVNSGKGIDAWWWMNTNTSVSCATAANRFDGIGGGDTGESFKGTFNVDPDTKYYYRFCGKDKYGNISAGSLFSFTTKPRLPNLTCGFYGLNGRAGTYRYRLDLRRDTGSTSYTTYAFTTGFTGGGYAHAQFKISSDGRTIAQYGSRGGYKQGTVTLSNLPRYVELEIIGSGNVYWEMRMGCP